VCVIDLGILAWVVKYKYLDVDENNDDVDDKYQFHHGELARPPIINLIVFRH